MPLLSNGNIIYLDHQASTPVAPSVLAEMLPFFSEAWGNPQSDDHASGWQAADVIEVARGHVADAIGAIAAEIIFTSGATEANNIAILGAAASDPQRGAVVVSAIEHSSVLAIGMALARAGHELRVVPVDSSGRVDVDAFAAALRGHVTIASIGAVNNEIGVVQDIAQLSDLCRERGVLLHSDMTQALAWNAADVEASGVDLASFSAHKARGPKGIGALFLSTMAADRVAPVSFGGGQEGGLRPGTLPTPLCVGFGAACRLLPGDAELRDWVAVTARLRSGLEQLVPGLVLNGLESPRHPGNLNVRAESVDAQLLIARLQPRVALSRGSACTSGTPEPSHVLRALGLTTEQADGSMRFSTGPDTTEQDVDEALSELSIALGHA